MADDAWWTIEGDTAGERIRDGLPQLIVLAVLSWALALGTYRVLATVDPLLAGGVVVVGGLYAGTKLRGLLLADEERIVEGDPPRENGEPSVGDDSPGENE